MSNEIPTNGPTPFGWHSGEAGYRCLKEHQLANERKITTPKTETASAHAIGLMVHAGRARWFKLNFQVDWASIKDAMQAEAEAQPLPVSIDDQNKALEIVRQYIDYWCTYPSPTVIGAEYLVGPVETTPGSGELHTARLDDVSRYPEAGNGLWLGECKTTSRSPADVIRYYSSNAGQILKQALLWKHASQGEAMHGPISGIMLEIIKKPSSRSDECKFIRHPITVEPWQLEWFVESEQYYREQTKNHIWPTPENPFPQKKGITWNSKVPRNPTSCTRMVAGDILVECPFVRLCKHGKDVAGEYMIDGKFLSQWEPSPGRETAPWL